MTPSINHENTLFQTLLTILNEHFATMLWKAKSESSYHAFQNINVEQNPSKRMDIFNKYFRDWVEESVIQIRNYFPQYVEFALAYPNECKPNSIDWARQTITKVLVAHSGLLESEDNNRWFSSLKPIYNETIRWWCAVATENNMGVNVEYEGLNTWMLPKWMCPDEKSNNQILRLKAGDIEARYTFVLREESQKAQLKQAIQIRQSEQLKIIKSNKPSGRPSSRPAEFTILAGDLWRAAKSENKPTRSPTKISLLQLASIALELDQGGFTPPSKYLEGKIVKELLSYNSRNSRTQKGSIQTWVELVNSGDSDFITGMRKLLSRCANKSFVSSE